MLSLLGYSGIIKALREVECFYFASKRPSFTIAPVPLARTGKSVDDGLLSRSDMKEITLTKGKVAIVDDADYEWLMQRSWYYSPVTHYAYAGINDRIVSMHRYIKYAIRGQEIDHINGDSLDNRKQNLRFATHAQNMSNRDKQSNNTSGYKGVTFDKSRNKWVVRVTYNNKNYNVGRFANKEDAAREYDRVAKEKVGKFARLNFPEELPVQ